MRREVVTKQLRLNAGSHSLQHIPDYGSPSQNRQSFAAGRVFRFLREPCAGATGGYERSDFMIRVLAAANRGDLLALQPIGQ